MELNQRSTVCSAMCGIIRSVDPVNRDLVVHVGRSLVRFDVPPTCVISLRNDRIRLRVLQPGDRVRITFTETAGVRQALRIEAQPLPPDTN